MSFYSLSLEGDHHCDTLILKGSKTPLGCNTDDAEIWGAGRADPACRAFSTAHHNAPPELRGGIAQHLRPVAFKNFEIILLLPAGRQFF